MISTSPRSHASAGFYAGGVCNDIDVMTSTLLLDLELIQVTPHLRDGPVLVRPAHSRGNQQVAGDRLWRI